MTYTSMLATKRRAAVDELNTIQTAAATEKRTLSVDENRRASELLEVIDSIQSFEDRHTESDKLATESEATLRNLLAQPIDRRHARPDRADAETLDAFRSAVIERNPRPIEVRDNAPRSLYQPGIEARDLSTSSPANLRPVSLYGQIIEHLVETSAVMRAGATVLTTQTGEDLRVARSTGLSSADIVAEADQIPESDPTLGTVTLGAYGFKVLITVSNEMVEDDTLDLQGYLARETGVALGNALGSYLINGTGTGQPRGVLADATLGVTGPTGTATSLGGQSTAGQGTDLLNDLVGSLAEPYTRARAAAFLLRTGTLTAIRNLKASTGELVGNQFISTSPWPFYVDPFVPAMAANAKPVLFGDWSRYFVRMVNGIKFEMSRDFHFDTDQTTFRAILRADGAMIDTSGAIKYLKNSAT